MPAVSELSAGGEPCLQRLLSIVYPGLTEMRLNTKALERDTPVCGQYNESIYH